MAWQRVPVFSAPVLDHQLGCSADTDGHRPWGCRAGSGGPGGGCGRRQKQACPAPRLPGDGLCGSCCCSVIFKSPSGPRQGHAYLHSPGLTASAQPPLDCVGVCLPLGSASRDKSQWHWIDRQGWADSFQSLNARCAICSSCRNSFKGMRCQNFSASYFLQVVAGSALCCLPGPLLHRWTHRVLRSPPEQQLRAEWWTAQWGG